MVLVLILVLGSVKSLVACIGLNRLYKAAAKVANVSLKKRKFALYLHQKTGVISPSNEVYFYHCSYCGSRRIHWRWCFTNTSSRSHLSQSSGTRPLVPR